MLVLTRKTEQAIIIDGHTIVRILAVDGERVKLGIQAPDYIAVLREELVRDVEGANRDAADAGPRLSAAPRLGRRLVGRHRSGVPRSAGRLPGLR